METLDELSEESADSIDHTDPDILERLYWGEGMTLKEIGDLSEVSGSAIGHHMEKHGIERRGKGELNRVERVLFRTRKDGYEVWDGSDKFTVHRLLAISEYGVDAVKGNDVHHKKPIPWLNTPGNIEVESRTNHMQEHSPLEEGDVREIRRLKDETDMYEREIADRFGISRTYVSSIARGIVWKEV